MGGIGTPPEVRSAPKEPVVDNVTAFRRPPARPKSVTSAASETNAQPRLPVALIFICLVVVYVAIRYFWR
jgi:hypothetical protein